MVSRNDLKYNFLKNIIFRIDFEGVFLPEIENIIVEAKEYLREKSFTRYIKKENNNIEINFLTSNEVTPKINQSKMEDIHSFSNEESGYTLDLSTKFICLMVTSQTYHPFEEYAEIVSTILEIYKEKIPFFTIKRIGIRKINICMLDNKNNISKFFSKESFKFFDDFPEINSISSFNKEFFILKNTKVNLINEIQQGTVEDKIKYQIKLDIDVYLDEENVIEEYINKNDKLNEINNINFKIFKKSLTNEFLDALINEKVEYFAELEGIERNE